MASIVGRASLCAAVLLSACAADPFTERRERPRSETGWVAVGRGVRVAAPPEYAAAAEARDRQVVTDCAGPRSSGATAILESYQGPGADRRTINGSDAAGEISRYRIAVTACGETRLHAVYPLRPIPEAGVELGAPGGSIASLALQRAVMDQVGPEAAGIIAAGFPEGACDGAANAPWVVDTALAAPPRKGRWSETWTFAVCGVRRTITVSFEETETGAEFSAPITLE